MQLKAYISQFGLHGEIHFIHKDDNSIEIQSKLETTLQYPDQIWSWAIHELPIDYREIDWNRRCLSANLGAKVIEFDNHLGYLQLPGNESVVWHLPSEIVGKYKNNNNTKICLPMMISILFFYR